MTTPGRFEGQSKVTSHVLISRDTNSGFEDYFRNQEKPEKGFFGHQTGQGTKDENSQEIYATKLRNTQDLLSEDSQVPI